MVANRLPPNGPGANACCAGPDRTNRPKPEFSDTYWRVITEEANDPRYTTGEAHRGGGPCAATTLDQPPTSAGRLRRTDRVLWYAVVPEKVRDWGEAHIEHPVHQARCSPCPDGDYGRPALSPNSARKRLSETMVSDRLIPDIEASFRHACRADGSGVIQSRRELVWWESTAPAEGCLVAACRDPSTIGHATDLFHDHPRRY
jgi:hypothetical protein